MSPGVEIVGGEELEHEEQEVCGQADQHRLVLDVLLRVQPGLGSAPPDVRADRCSGDRDAFPDPERDEDRPPGPVDHLEFNNKRGQIFQFCKLREC